VIDRQFSWVLERAVDDGLAAAALVERHGATVGLAGAIAEEEAMPLAALVMHRLASDDLAARLFAGEVVALALDDREVAVAIAKRQLFVVAVLGTGATASQLERVRELRDAVARMLADDDAITATPWGGGGGGSGGGPAQLSLVEYGLTVRRERGKA
jgi:hypothetical protein